MVYSDYSHFFQKFKGGKLRMKAERTIVIKENENIEEIEQYEEEIIKLLAKILIEIQDL